MDYLNNTIFEKMCGNEFAQAWKNIGVRIDYL